MFSSAFPLAPICAFFNNIFEIRIDAVKYTKYKKRTIPVRTKSIGIWYPIFRFIAMLAIVTNVRFRKWGDNNRLKNKGPKFGKDFRVENFKRNFIR